MEIFRLKNNKDFLSKEKSFKDVTKYIADISSETRKKILHHIKNTYCFECGYAKNRCRCKIMAKGRRPE